MIGLGDVVMILELRRQGLSISAIAREVGLDRKTIRRYLARGVEPPAYGPRQPRPTLLDPFTGYLRERVNVRRDVRSATGEMAGRDGTMKMPGWAVSGKRVVAGTSFRLSRARQRWLKRSRRVVGATGRPGGDSSRH